MNAEAQRRRFILIQGVVFTLFLAVMSVAWFTRPGFKHDTDWRQAHDDWQGMISMIGYVYLVISLSFTSYTLNRARQSAKSAPYVA